MPNPSPLRRLPERNTNMERQQSGRGGTRFYIVLVIMFSWLFYVANNTVIIMFIASKLGDVAQNVITEVIRLLPQFTRSHKNTHCWELFTKTVKPDSF